MPNTAPEADTHVAVGLLVQGGKVLVTRRADHVHQGGKWEFPGGKLAPGEPIEQGLQRELHEELGIDVVQAQPFIHVLHRYPEKRVLLDVWRVTRFRGQPHGREGQPMQWMSPFELRPSEFPPADRPILRRLQLPSLYAVTDAGRIGVDPFLARLERALHAGLRLVQLREPQMESTAYRDYARRVVALCHRYDATILLNADPQWVGECGADGVHLNSRRLTALSQRPLPTDQWVASSCHNAAELEQAQRIDADFAVLAPVAPTPSHPHAVPLGWNRFGQLTAGVALPVYALGGMGPNDLTRARAAGAQGVAMVSRLWHAASPEGVVRAMADDQPPDSPR